MFCRLNLLPYFCSVDIKNNKAKMEAKVKPQDLNYQTTKFENLGFFVEYIVDGKFIGTKIVKENESGKIGYESTTHHVADSDIVFKNKKIKAGTKYYTRIYPLCGKVIKK